MVSIGDRVRSKDFEGEVTSIQTGYINDRGLIVREDDGTLHKCFESEVVVIQDPKPDDGLISEEDFEKAVEKILDPSTFEKMEKSSRTIVTVTGGMICELLRRELFDKG